MGVTLTDSQQGVVFGINAGVFLPVSTTTSMGVLLSGEMRPGKRLLHGPHCQGGLCGLGQRQRPGQHRRPDRRRALLMRRGPAWLLVAGLLTALGATRASGAEPGIPPRRALRAAAAGPPHSRRRHPLHPRRARLSTTPRRGRSDASWRFRISACTRTRTGLRGFYGPGLRVGPPIGGRLNDRAFPQRGADVRRRQRGRHAGPYQRIDGQLRPRPAVGAAHRTPRVCVRAEGRVVLHEGDDRRHDRDRVVGLDPRRQCRPLHAGVASHIDRRSARVRAPQDATHLRATIGHRMVPLRHPARVSPGCWA